MADTIYPLGIVDYIVFALFLAISFFTGLYHGFNKGGQTTIKRFLLADRSVFSIPVAMTLLASFVSPISLLGTPAETFVHGGLYFNAIFGYILLYSSIALIFVPVFYDLNITSAYEYLQMRYNVVLRILGAATFILQTTMYMAIVTYSPALAIQIVTGFALWKTILITATVVTVYTAMGGMKGVIWTDVFMFCVMFGTTLLVIIVGCIQVGGILPVWEINKQDGRLDIFYFPFDVTERTTFPSLVFGGWLTFMPLWAVSQTAVQRMLSAKTLKQAKISVWLNLPFVSLIKFLQCFQGLMMYAYYYGSREETRHSTESVKLMQHEDSVLTTDVMTVTTDSSSPVVPAYTKPDQILIYYISGQFGNIPGFQGIFIACIFAGTLSTVSSGLNSLVAVTLIDVIRPFRTWIKTWRTCHQEETNESTDLVIIKILTIVYGGMTTGLAFLASNYGTLISMIYRLLGSIGGPLVGIFITGMFCRRANARGALVGLLSGMVLGIWLIIGTRVNEDNLDNALPIYKLSFTWYATFTTLTTVVMTCLVSEVTRCLMRNEESVELDQMLFVTFLRKDDKGVVKRISKGKEIDDETRVKEESL